MIRLRYVFISKRFVIFVQLDSSEHLCLLVPVNRNPSSNMIILIIFNLIIILIIILIISI